MALAAHDATDRAEQLIILTQRLTAALRAEINAYEARDFDAVRAGQGETLTLANLYRHESQKIKGNPDLLADLAPPLKQTLIETTELFNATLEQHIMTVDAVKRLSEGLVQVIANEISAQRTQNLSYGPDSYADPAHTTAIALDKQA